MESKKSALKVIIMAAGKGTRMKSDLPKVLHRLAGKTMLDHVIDSVELLSPEELLLIIGHGSQQVIDSFDQRVKVSWIEQKTQQGTGHAIMQVSPSLEGFSGNVLILSGDVPLLSVQTLQKLLEQHQDTASAATILTTSLENPFGYGRIIKQANQVTKIVEEKDATSQEKMVKEINSGTYCFNWPLLAKFLPQLTPKNAQGEYYLTDIIGLLVENGHPVSAFSTDSSEETMGINDRATLASMSKIFRQRINQKLMLDGVTIIDPETTYIDVGVQIGRDTVIYPNTIVEGKTTIGENCLLGPNSQIVDSEVGAFCEIVFSSVKNSTIGKKSKVGPFSRLRESVVLGEECKIGNFVELKKSVFADGVKASHLAYIGDSEAGENTNIGAGTITCNYDGKNKNKTIIGSNAFIGSNSTLVAPIKIEADSYVAAGSVITENVPSFSLGVGRARQRNVEEWVLRKRGEKKDAGK